MVLLRREDAPVFETPNGVMRQFVSPSSQATEMAVWEVEMKAGAAGPEHRMSSDQLHRSLRGRWRVIVDGRTELVEEGDAVFIRAGALRRIAPDGDDGARALVVSLAGGRATMPDGQDRGVPPWSG
ncbi:MAG: cupin domain-containing protein [Brevundimonas sp.]|nr:cupin domain-containing protein [Brevundimonas sp.]